MNRRSIFYRKAGDAEWIRAVGPASGFSIEDLPAQVKYEVGIGDREIREVITTLQVDEEPAEVCLGPCLLPQPLCSRTPPD